MNDNVSISEKSENIKRSIEECYISAIGFLELYRNSKSRHAGNHNIYYINFASKFQSLFYLTKVDRGIRNKKTVGDRSLVDDINNWIENGIENKHKEGIDLFLAYANILFDEGVLSFKK